MEITWLGHSCIRIRVNGATLITDPYDDSLGLSMGRPVAQIITVSNSHPHHSHVSGVGGDPIVIDGPGEYEIGEFYISGVGTAHTVGGREERRINTVFSLRVEGLTLCHLGDLSRPLSPQLIQQLGHTDVLLVPAGGGCTVTTSQAADLVGQLAPRIVIPMHYASGQLTTVELGPLDPFLSDMGLIEVAREKKVNVTLSTLPRDLRVVILDRAP